MTKTNDYKTKGGFYPIEDDAKPAPTTQIARAPEDDRPWTKADDDKLKRALGERQFEAMSDEQKPWTVIATRCNFGHNSGSCKARWAVLSKEIAKGKYHGVKSVQFGAKGKGIVGSVGRFSTEVAIPAR